MTEAITFARGWLALGWVATVTGPDGRAFPLIGFEPTSPMPVPELAAAVSSAE